MELKILMFGAIHSRKGSEWADKFRYIAPGYNRAYVNQNIK